MGTTGTGKRRRSRKGTARSHKSQDLRQKDVGGGEKRGATAAKLAVTVTTVGGDADDATPGGAEVNKFIPVEREVVIGKRRMRSSFCFLLYHFSFFFLFFPLSFSSFFFFLSSSFFCLRSSFFVLRPSFSVLRSSFFVLRSSFLVFVLHSPFSILRSPFFVLRSPVLLFPFVLLLRLVLHQLM